MWCHWLQLFVCPWKKCNGFGNNPQVRHDIWTPGYQSIWCLKSFQFWQDVKMSASQSYDWCYDQHIILNLWKVFTTRFWTFIHIMGISCSLHNHMYQLLFSIFTKIVDSKFYNLCFFEFLLLSSLGLLVSMCSLVSLGSLVSELLWFIVSHMSKQTHACRRPCF